ncbi:hypothetical protein ACFLU5_10510 [Bacteroidota bacterium]
MIFFHNSSLVYVLLLIAGLIFSCQPKQDVHQLRFEGETAEYRFVLDELDPKVPSNWSAYEFLVMEMKVTTPQRFSLKAYTPGGMCRMLIQPVGQNVWFRAAIPLQYFKGRDASGHDMAAANNRPRNSFWMSVWGPFGNIDQIDSIGIMMDHPAGNPEITIRSIALSNEDPGSEILEKIPVVDSLGQWIYSQGERKINDFDQLRTAWAAEDEKLESEFNYCEYGGNMDTTVRGSGHFRIEEINGKWWFVDPHGHLFLSTGTNVVRSEQGTRINNRETYYQALPDSQQGGSIRSFRDNTFVSFYTWNLQRRFGETWETKWADYVVKRMDAWGLTTIGCWSAYMDSSHKKPYTVWLSDWNEGVDTYLGMPDVYSEEFAANVDELARQSCVSLKDDPYVLGYFIGNEPPWPNRESELADMFLNGLENPTQKKLKAFLAIEDTPERRKEFFIKAFETYLILICDAIKKYDPNHLNLGIRFGGSPPLEVITLGEMFDVYSLNVYNISPVEAIQRAYQQNGGRPVLIGEFHFGAPGNGLGAGLVQVRDQKERGVAYRYYVEQAAALPSFLGAHWFQWIDQPVTGRMDGENYNIGLIDVSDRPYWDFIEGVKTAHMNLFDVHMGEKPPVSIKALAQ